MRPFSLLVKPSGADCNLRCQYCFYLDRAALYPATSRLRMPYDVLERLISSYMATDQPQYAFGWQGGEPTLMGADFFRKVTDLQQKHGHPGAVVANGLQTNATLIDDALADHLARYKFLLGVSLDGAPEIHNRYRLTADGRPTHAAVMNGVECLNRHQVEFNILVLVSAANVKRAAEVYRYLCERDFRYHQYIPCVEFDADGRPLPHSIRGEEWGEFLCRLFDAWKPSDTRRISIRHFDSVLSKLVDGVENVCQMGRNCCQYFVVEHNGDVYPCDFFVQPALKLGNIMENSWQEIGESPVYRDFGAMKSSWNAACDTCPYAEVCAGDCLKHRFHGGADPRRLSWLCAGWKMFYEHALPTFRQLAAEIARERAAQAAQADRMVSSTFQRVAGSIRPNAPCPCGSGRKHKHCCGRKAR